MKILNINLADESKQYHQFKYSAGEWQVRFDDRPTADIIRVTARILCAEDIVKLALLRNAIGPGYCELVLPYLPYSRADRQFTSGDCCGLEVFGQLIGAMGFDVVVTLDSHNPDAAKLYVPFLVDRSPMPIIHRAIGDFAARHKSSAITVLFPDKGAVARYAMPNRLECNTGHIDIAVMHCEKKRNQVTGELEGFDIPALPGERPAIIVDDICDGGGTFIGIAEELGLTSLGSLRHPRHFQQRVFGSQHIL